LHAGGGRPGVGAPRAPRARRSGLLAALLILSAAAPAPARAPEAAGGSPQEKEPPAPRSVLLITLDTTRADHLHCYGYPLPTSPALDRLASDGAIFLGAITQAVNTNPSHASLLTGLYPRAHGNHFNSVPLDPEFETLTTILAKAGYRTGAFVSGYTMVASQSGFDRGFEIYDDRFTGQERKGAETVDRALAWLKALPADKPYFLFVHLFDPHGKYDPPPGFADRFRTGRYDPIPESAEIPEYQRREIGGKVSRDPLEYVSRYDGEIRYADDQIRRLLEAAGEKTVVVFAADHGETLADRDYYFSHGARLNEEAVRIPLILRFPEKGLRGKRIGGVAQMVDVLPTLLSYLGRQGPRRLDGRDLLPFIRVGAIPAGGCALSEARAAPMILGGRRVVFPLRVEILSARNDRFKLISYPTQPEPTLEIFDLEKDPGERNNLAGSAVAGAAPLRQALDLYRVSGRPPAPPELDDEAKQKLRSLGYVN
jgi:choline-sulfatase